MAVSRMIIHSLAKLAFFLKFGPMVTEARKDWLYIQKQGIYGKLNTVRKGATNLTESRQEITMDGLYWDTGSITGHPEVPSMRESEEMK